MYAVMTTGGKQVKVAQGDVIRVEKLEVAVGETIELDQINLIATDDALIVAPKDLEKSKVVCEVVRQGRGKKIRVFKMKRRKNYSRTQGHRQSFTELRVREIVA